jgi:hypothetical protein
VGRQQHQQPLPQQQQAQQQPQQQRSYVKYALGSEQEWSLPTGLAVTWLGTSSGTPTRDRNISCTLVRLPGAMYMVDCGEGSHRQARCTGLRLEQVRLRGCGVGGVWWCFASACVFCIVEAVCTGQ